MKYSRLGNTGLIVSRLSFGVMTFGSTGPSDPRSSVWKAGQDEATALISRSIDAGINFFDAADAYADQSRALTVTRAGQREMLARFGLHD